MIRLCDYGCGKKAKHQFKNGKWCCNKSSNSCPSVNKRRSNSLKGVYVGELSSNYGKPAWNRGIKDSIITRKKKSKSQKGKKNSMYGKPAWNKGVKGCYSEETIQKKREAAKNRKYTYDSIEKIRKSKRYYIHDIKMKHPLFYKIEELKYNPDKPKEKEIQVHCKNRNCPNSKEQGGWFTPTKSQLYERIRSIERPHKMIENNFYCTKTCKLECGYMISKMKKIEKMRSDMFSGNGNPNWRGGISYEPYCEQWSDIEYKESIKERDGHICLNPECKKITNKLCVHHIDYNKKNCHPLNLITICISCNSKANINRRWHKAWYKAIIYNRYKRI